MLAGIATALVLAGSGTGATTVTVTISKNGYVPKATTVAVGDTVRFTNSDTVVHQVAFKSTSGVTCTPNPVVVQPSQTASCTFATAGKYSYSDPNAKGKSFQGTVTVDAAGGATLTVRAAPLIVVYGGRATLSGTLATGATGQNVQIVAQPCGAGGAKAIGAATTTTGGAFTASVTPTENTVYSAKLKGSSSTATTVHVRPRLQLTKLAAHRYRVRVLAATSLTGKYISFQRYNASSGRWTRVRTVTLATTAAGTAPTTISSAGFKSSIRARVRVRAALPQAQAGACYLGGTSNTIRS
jgi:plastocyanin